MEGEIAKLKQIIIEINGELERIPGPSTSDVNGYALDYCCECNAPVMKKQCETNTCHVHGIGYIVCDDCFQAEV